jgi:hypothetical protein
MKFIITENQISDLFFRRRMDKFENFLKSTVRWLNPKAFDNYDKFFEGVVFSSISDFIAAQEYFDDITFDKIRDEMLPFMIEFVKNEYGDEIRDYYEKEIRK